MSKYYPTSVCEKINSCYIDNLYLCHNKFFCKKDVKNDTKYISLLYETKKTWSSDCKNSKLLSDLNNRTKSLAKSYVECDKVGYSPKSRLMIGTGVETPYSNVLLMTLHQTYGFPYIPATAIKGCLRNYYEQENPERVKKLFGVSEDEENLKGCLVFFDIFPKKYTLEFDAMTPHNTSYYGSKGEKKPSDSDMKNPLMIPCLTNESKFKIYIACTDDKVWKEDGSTIMCNLRKALSEYGLGGKTSYGYGLS